MKPGYATFLGIGKDLMLMTVSSTTAYLAIPYCYFALTPLPTLCCVSPYLSCFDNSKACLLVLCLSNACIAFPFRELPPLRLQHPCGLGCCITISASLIFSTPSLIQVQKFASNQGNRIPKQFQLWSPCSWQIQARSLKPNDYFTN